MFANFAICVCLALENNLFCLQYKSEDQNSLKKRGNTENHILKKINLYKMKKLIKHSLTAIVALIILNLTSCIEEKKIVVEKWSKDWKESFERNIGRITFYNYRPFNGILKHNNKDIDYKAFEITFKDGIEVEWKWWKDGKEVTYEQYKYIESVPAKEYE